MQSKAKTPTFLFIGPDKTGSSWMFHLLERHPQCFVPKAKDIYFFDRYFDKGVPWYLSHFRNARPEHAAVGELSHDYLFSDVAAQRIANTFPAVKLLVCLRNPVDRAISQFQYLRRGGEVSGEFEAALRSHPRIISNSQYQKHLERYMNLFPRDQIKLLIFDDLVRDPREFGKDMLRFLGVEPCEQLPYEDRVREAEMARNRALSRALKYGANLTRRVGLSNVVGQVKHGRIAPLFYRKLRPDESVQLSSSQRVSLWRHFEREIPVLSEYAARDLSHWTRT